MSKLKFQFVVAPKDYHCWRCKTLGITQKTILKGEVYVTSRSGKGKKHNMCGDCYDRLYEEVMEFDEGEEWKK